MSIRTIACCTDFSSNSEAAFLTSIDMAKKYKAKLVILHVLPPLYNPVLMDAEMLPSVEADQSLRLKLEERMAQEYSERIDSEIEHQRVVLEGHVSTEILTYLEQNPIDLQLKKD